MTQIHYRARVRAVLLSLFLPLAASAATPTTVATDLSGLDEASFAALDGVAFEKTATVRLVQEGFAVVARTATPQVLVSVSLRPDARARAQRARTDPRSSLGR